MSPLDLYLFDPAHHLAGAWLATLRAQQYDDHEAQINIPARMGGDAHQWYSTYVWVDLPNFERDFMNRFDYVHPEQALYMIKDRVQKPLESVAEYRNRFYRMFVRTEQVRPGYQEVIAQELTIPVAQLVDDLPLYISSQDDEHPIPHVLSRTLTPYLQWSASLEGATERIPPSQQQYLDPRTIRDLAFFRNPTAEQCAVIREEEEEEESTGSDEDEDGLEAGGNSNEELGEEDETPEEGSYSEHSEGEQSEEEEEDEEGEEEHDKEPVGSEWEAVPEEAMCMGTEAEDPETARKREEIAVGKELELANATSLQTPDDPNRDPEPPRPEDGDLTATTPTPSTRQRSRYPSSPTRPPVRRRTDTGDRPSSPITLSPSS
ncbi:hypothetical protein CBR_g8612 [Chara braunii]|uniref:Retrotransposon gag domain-containing protein n=1 Tax=Chara braunii TaxID=69332 RepID=A0A388JS15_CHABU|nr:hypothetical protein CBR_g8612 [Chara braunii]|eukprot:GBG60591.1 hypothetical protein CBR_g8612 [Chara braunii]